MLNIDTGTPAASSCSSESITARSTVATQAPRVLKCHLTTSSGMSDVFEDLLHDDGDQLRRSAKCFQMAWAVIKRSASREHLQGSMLVHCRNTSSSCSGGITAEMSLATVAKTINDDGWLGRYVSYRPISLFDSRLTTYRAST
eukprot:TRINITY_DN11960_c0_g1_i2.p1 TRINITY_DN11960_c0_g1~~TRINITY_DN11960_c0_g1_i2.p1  ORF type:complete len:143 (+),score=15.10 TRINITY_DN11960_c0_g1_i2:139-567(+)